MKYRFILICFTLLHFCVGRSQNHSVNTYTGVWTGENIKLTLRKKIKFLKYEFETIQVNAKLSIQENFFVTGSVGTAPFKNVQAKENKGNPKKTGVSYLVPCGTLIFDCKGKTFKIEQFEIWLLSNSEKGKLSVEFRSREKFDLYPLGGCTLDLNQ